MEAEKVKDILINDLEFTHKDLEKLSKFHDELLKFNKNYNFISKSTENEVWSRHILDSAQIVKFIDFKKPLSLADLGTGAGFPGIILAIFNKNSSKLSWFDNSTIQQPLVSFLLILFFDSQFLISPNCFLAPN